ncbi:unnamed protein product [Trifolium pratense]|uniref:Uncharacterized protein n=1 Tax=Trifolium pratense TaxID=57577 RepID=A0ACB0KU08_TRIPR|nr:unnamed protein product [Trifolium pratense]
MNRIQNNRSQNHKQQQKETTPAQQKLNSVTGALPSPSTVLEDGWSEEATFTLIDAWGKLYKKLNRKNFRQYHWKEIAKAVNQHHGYSRKSLRTYVHCKNRFDALKKKYAIEKARVSENGFYDNDDDDAFPFFDKLDSLIGDSDTLPAKKVSTPLETPVKVPAWTLAPVGLRSGAQSAQKRPATATTEEESVEEDARFRRNLSAFAAAAAAAAEAEIDNSDSDDSYFDNSDGSELSNENRKRKRGRKDVEFGYREVAGRNNREFRSTEVANFMEKFSEVQERVESSKQRRNAKEKFSEIHERVESSKQRRNAKEKFSEIHERVESSKQRRNAKEKFSEVNERVESLKQRRNAKEKFSEIHERVESSKQRRNVDLEKRNMQFEKDCQRMLQLQNANHSKETERTTSMNDRNEQISKVKNLPAPTQKSQSTKRTVRGATQMKKLAHALIDGQKLSIEFDESTAKPLGENKTKFRSYVAFLGRSKVSILTDDWDSVDQSVKDEIWTDILKVWDVPHSGFLRKKLVAYAGERWRAFKTNLTSRYIHGDLRDRSPLEIYNFLDEGTWQAFVQTRLDPSFQEIRKKAQMRTAQNKTPHRLSRGGYDLLQEKMMQEKLKEKPESLGGSVAAPPSPPPRHEQWKRARQKPSGDYTSEDTRIIAEKIDSLVEKTSQGTFVPEGRNDILTEAIGRPEHSGFIRGVGGGLGIRQYFGPPPRGSTPRVFSSEQIQTIKVELTQQIKEELMQNLEAMGFSRKPSNFPSCSRNTAVPASRKGSSSVVPPIAEEDEIPEQCELYVDNLFHPVAYGNVYKLGPTIHNQMLENDMVRVAVSEVLEAHAQVPIPTDEVETVEQALNNFIQWPKRLVQIVSDKDFDVDGSEKDGVSPKKSEPQLDSVQQLAEKDDVSPKKSEPQLDSVQQLVLKAMCMSESIKLDLEHDRMKSLWLSQRDIMELCMGKQELSITILRLWLTYLNRLSINVGKNDLYGFIDPCFIQSQHDPTNAEAYIQNKLSDDKKECYLAPYHNNHHWQLLIICPRQNNVVFLCSLERKPDKNIIHIVDSALDGYHLLRGVQKEKPTWIYPICQRQPESYESGYYIMIHTLNIVSAGIINLWMKVFGNPEPFQEDELVNVRQRCASLILDFIQGV